MPALSRYLIPLSFTIRQALKKIERNALGCAFLADARGQLKAIVTDGDVRRALLRGATLESPVKKAANFKPLFVRTDTPSSAIVALMADRKIKILPIVDADKKIIDFIKYDKEIYFPVARPIFAGNELKYVSEAIISGWVSSVGKYVFKFEEEFARYCGTKYAVACSSGTTALHLALLALGIGPGDEVIVPSLTFIATANAVRYVGAEPVFVDVEPRYWQIDSTQIEAAVTKRTKAVIPVHLYGHPAKMDAIMVIAKKHGLKVVEDAAEALGAAVRGRLVGTWGDIGVFSFFGNKIITTGEGGMLTTNDAALADTMRILRDHGMSKERRYWHVILGYNYRTTNVQAAIGLAQLERIDQILKRKIQIGRWYGRHLQGIPGITCHRQAPWARNVYWMYCICVQAALAGISRDDLIFRLKEIGIETRPFFVPTHRQPVYSEYADCVLPVTDELSEAGINLPSSVDMTEASVKHIAVRIKRIVGRRVR